MAAKGFFHNHGEPKRGMYCYIDVLLMYNI